MDIKDNFEEILMIYAVKNFKNRSLAIMIDKGVNLEMENERGFTPLG